MDMDMDDTAVGPSAFLQMKRGSESVVPDDDEEGGTDGDDDMDLTEALRENILRRRSLRNASEGRPPLSNIPITSTSQDHISDHHGVDRTQDSFTDDTQSSMDTDSFMQQPVEYTVPLSKPLKKRGPPDEAWLALRAMTHSGDTPLEPTVSSDEENSLREGDDMDLDDAVRRLEEARSSFTATDDAQGGEGMEDSFSSMDDSLEERIGHGEETINVTEMLRKASLGALSEVSSTMEATSVYGGVIVGQGPSGPIAHDERPLSPPKQKLLSNSTTFYPPSSNTTDASSSKIPTARKPAKSTIPQPFSFSFTPKSTSTAPSTPRPPSPTKAKVPAKPNTSPKKPAQIPTAAFALPVARPSPKRPAAQTNSEGDDHRPSPAKRMAMANKWVDAATPSASPAVASTSTVPKPLPPNKKAPFQTSSTPAPPPAPTSQSLRRPSGYFARRRSMLADSSAADNSTIHENSNPQPSRKSVGGLTISKTQGLVSARDIEMQSGELEQQAVASRSYPREPPRPNAFSPVPQISVPVSDPDVLAHLSASPSVEIEPRQHLDSNELGMQMAATEQWREGVMGQEFAQDDEGVRAHLINRDCLRTRFYLATNLNRAIF